MNCVICGNFRSDSKTLNLSAIGAQTICHILGIKEPERTHAVASLQRCKICEECSENIRDVYLTLHKASKVSVEIDEWRLKFFQKLGSDSKPESEVKKQKLAMSSLKVQKRHELTKKVRSHIRRELRVDKKAEKITSLRMLLSSTDPSIRPLAQGFSQPETSSVPYTNSLEASVGPSGDGVQNRIHIQSTQMHQLVSEVDVEYPQPLQNGEDQQLTLGFYTEREMEEELVENAKSANGEKVEGYALRILDSGTPGENKRKFDGLLEQLDRVRNKVSIPTSVPKKCTSPNRRKQTIKLSCYDFKRPKVASAATSSTAELREQDPVPSNSQLQSQVQRKVQAIRSSSSASPGLQRAKSLTGITLEEVQQDRANYTHSSSHKTKSDLLPKLGFGQSIAVMDDDNSEISESAPNTEHQQTNTRRGEIVDIISYKSIMNGDDDDDDEDYDEDYETTYGDEVQDSCSGAESKAEESDAREALKRLAALGQCDIEHITVKVYNESNFEMSASNGLSFEGYNSLALKDAPFDIVNVESPNINCDESNDTEGVIVVEV